MYATNGAPQRARWQVVWVKGKRVVKVECNDDFGEAIRIYTKAVLAGKTGATLRCKNMSFPPPLRLRPRHIEGKRRNDRGKLEMISGLLTPMRKLNRKGIWWCPYCVKLRRFVERKGFNIEGQWVPEHGHHCPVCKISHRDGSVRQWNPIAARMMVEPTRRRRKKRQRNSIMED